MDALSHSIEGYWSNRATPVTDALAISAAKLLLDQLSNAQRNPQDLTARRLTMEGSMLAGLTISNARTTAVHAASYPMTVYYGIPHGLACALLLPPFIRFNSGAMAPQKERRLLDALGAVSMCDLADSVERLQAKLDLPAKLGDVGIGTDEISQIVANGFRPDRMANNPRQVTAEDLTMLLEATL
jgi:alcohol dehydrogenase